MNADAVDIIVRDRVPARAARARLGRAGTGDDARADGRRRGDATPDGTTVHMRSAGARA